MTDDGPEARDDDEPQAHPLEAPKATHQIHQQWVDKGQVIGRDPNDQMPRPVAPNSITDAQAPWPTEQNFVCMGDFRQFVLREFTLWKVVATFKPEEVTRTPSGIYIVPTQLAADRCPDDVKKEDGVIAPLNIVLMALNVARQGFHVVEAGRAKRLSPVVTMEWTEVEPVRPQCQHYARQLPDFPHEPDADLGIRMCTARRVDYGDFLSLNDGLMAACDLRSPPLGNNVDLLHQFERNVIERGRAAVKKRDALDDAPDGEDHFDAAKAVEEEKAGIFGGSN